MARPRKLVLVDERPVVPIRPEDNDAPAPVQETVPAGEAAALIRQLQEEKELALRQRNEAMQAADRRISEADAAAKSASETIEALRKEAIARLGSLQQERDQARAEATEAKSEKQKTAAVATAVSLGLVRHIIGEAAKIASWFPALGALLGGFWLFDRTVAATPSAQTLVELALYGAVVVAPAVLVTVKKGSGSA